MSKLSRNSTVGLIIMATNEMIANGDTKLYRRIKALLKRRCK